MPRHARLSAHADVKLKEVKHQGKKECWCEVILQLPGEAITAKESTMNMFAATDIVQEKLKVQLRKYKDKHGGSHKNPFKRILQRIRPSQDE
jgi:putative sigma-54 modulation protein